MPYPKHNKHFVINHVQAQNTYCMPVILSATHAITLVTTGRHFGKNFAHWVIISQPDTFLRLDCIVPKKKGENTGTSDMGKSVGLPILDCIVNFEKYSAAMIDSVFHT